MQCIRRELQHAVLHEDTHIVHEEEAVLAKIIHARPTNILILRKISLFYPPPVAYTAGAAIAAFFILATALSVSWRSDWALLLICFGMNLMKENQVNLDFLE